MKAAFVYICLIVGALMMAGAFVGGIGYGLYLLGVAGATFGFAAWSGFLLWLKLIVGGFLLYVLGMIMAVTDKGSK